MGTPQNGQTRASLLTVAAQVGHVGPRLPVGPFSVELVAWSGGKALLVLGLRGGIE